MGGQVLEYEAKTIYRNGLQEGQEQMLLSLVQKGLIAIQIAAVELGISVEEVEERLHSNTV